MWSANTPTTLSAFELNEFRAIRMDRYAMFRELGRPSVNKLTVSCQVIFGQTKFLRTTGHLRLYGSIRVTVNQRRDVARRVEISGP